MTNCDRCGKQTRCTIMSMFNTQTICMDCKDAEEKDPRYKAAREADEDAIRRGDFNFGGIGRGK
jgi:ArsR family metal-binding transcriptional regulator